MDKKQISLEIRITDMNDQYQLPRLRLKDRHMRPAGPDFLLTYAFAKSMLTIASLKRDKSHASASFTSLNQIVQRFTRICKAGRRVSDGTRTSHNNGGIPA